LPKYTNMSLDWTRSGSYDRIHFLAYLKCWLEKWTETRAAAKDYRIIFLDVVACHMGPEIETYCWECGYVLIYHFAGTTSVMQVPDTHIHQPFSKLYLEVEQAKFTKRQEMQPGNVNRTLQEVLDDVVTVWRAMDHQRGVTGHWETGVANKLDGSEDGLIAGEALEVWKRQAMSILRQQAIADVDARVKAGELTSFSDVHKVIKDPLSPGEYRYGEEFEGEFPKHGQHWASAADELVLKQERADLAGLSSNIEASPIAAALMEKEATRIHTRLKDLEHVKALVVAAGVPVCRFTIERRITDLERNKQVLETDAGKTIHASLSAKLRVDRMTHHNVRGAARKKFAKAKAEKARAKLARAGIKKRLWMFKKEKKSGWRR
jgi:hypothetical protein